jgi:hypothetical protein
MNLFSKLLLKKPSRLNERIRSPSYTSGEVVSSANGINNKYDLIGIDTSIYYFIYYPQNCTVSSRYYYTNVWLGIVVKSFYFY